MLPAPVLILPGRRILIQFAPELLLLKLVIVAILVHLLALKAVLLAAVAAGGAITPPADSQAPSILRLEVRELGSQSAKIYWQTDENAFSKLRFGLTNNYEKGELPDNRLQSSGDFSLTGLVPGSRYFFRLILTDSNGNQTISESFLDTRTDDKIDETAGSCPKSADINSDRRVNLVDFSILLFNWGRLSNQHADLNCDGQVDLTDFSILLYYWQG